jgi:hypothetical protein
MNPLQESELEINEAIYPEVISDAMISQTAVQTDVIVEMTENRYSETETNRMEWVYILWQASTLIVTGIVVCIVFYYIS